MRYLVGSPVGLIRSGNTPLGQRVVTSGGGGVSPIAPDAVASGTLLRWYKSLAANMLDVEGGSNPGSGNPVGWWVDSSGGGGNARQTQISSPDKRPTYAEIGGANLPVTIYDGADDSMNDDDGTVCNFAETDPFTIFALVNFTSIPGSGYIPFIGKHDGAKGYHLNSSLFSNTHLGILFQGTGYLEVYGNTAMSTGSTYAVVVVNGGASASAVKMWINGTAQTCTVNATGGLSWGSGGITNTQPVALGQVTYAVTAFDGKLGESGIYSGAISDGDAAGLSKYLTNLAGL